jgi:putative transcriptional regulator
MHAVVKTSSFLADARSAGFSDEEPTPMSKAGSRIITAAEEALAFAEGRAGKGRAAKGYGVHTPEAIDIGALRQRLNLSQEAFAKSFGLPKRTIQDWEQGRRYPEGAARVLLKVIAHEPEAVKRALGAR